MPEAVLDFCANKPEEVFKGTKVLADSLKCGICSDLMLNPYTVNCGHSFCGGCLSHWFKLRSNRLTCPACRGTISGKPAPAIALREFAQQALASYERVTSTKIKLSADDTAFPGADELFGDMRYKGPIYDYEDDIYRCPECNFELEEGFCSRCDQEYPELDGDWRSSNAEEDEEEEDSDDSMDSDDRNFIDDDDEPSGPQSGAYPTLSEVEDTYGPQPSFVHDIHRRNGRWRACIVDNRESLPAHRRGRREVLDLANDDDDPYVHLVDSGDDDDEDSDDTNDNEDDSKHSDGDNDDDDVQVTLVRHRGGVVDDSSDSNE